MKDKIHLLQVQAYVIPLVVELVATDGWLAYGILWNFLSAQNWAKPNVTTVATGKIL